MKSTVCQLTSPVYRELAAHAPIQFVAIYSPFGGYERIIVDSIFSAKL